ncbi:hypothetical protein KR093_001028 [Drosophila rubida]|uniref:Caspase family p20 domain-containing protein n=1 Tax=Drosophila rubida TaxID=30044 RepID=A0AAD4PQF6_9MUSC|nr:hypothetical protein KR093_001028 [Drosophila rubida]
MGWWSKKKSTDEARSSSSDVPPALQDPRTRINTTSAATETTNTAVQNSTIFDSNKKTVTYLSTRQTVTHTQQARVTEVITRRTPSQKELDEMFAQMSMKGGTTTKTTTTTSSKRTTPSSLYGVALRSTPSFKATAEARRSSTLARMEQTTMSQKQGRTVTQHVETQRVALKSTKPSWPPSAASTATSSSSSALSKPMPRLMPLDQSYVSPYASRTGSSVLQTSKPTISTSTTTKRPTLSTPKNTVTTSIWSTTATPKTTANSSITPTPAASKVLPPRPYISLNPSKTGAVPKNSNSSISSKDAHGELKPSAPILKASVPKKKLKPAEVVIFNHEKFDNQNEYREGSADDVKALEKTFKALKCNVKIISNATLEEVRSNVRKLELKNFAERSALVLVLLSHGQRNDTLAARDGDYRIDDDVVFPIVRNRTLQDKPKILFVQACKGSREIGAFKTDSAQPHGPPSEILKCYSTYEGYVSYRYDDGTPFIKILCDTLSKKPHVDIATIMEEVRLLVKTYTKDAQIPTVTTSLTTKYVFGDYA